MTAKALGDPRTRAMLLVKALDDVVNRWEIDRRAEGAVVIGPPELTLQAKRLPACRQAGDCRRGAAAGHATQLG